MHLVYMDMLKFLKPFDLFCKYFMQDSYKLIKKKKKKRKRGNWDLISNFFNIIFKQR